MAATTQAVSKSTRLDHTRRRVERWRETRPHRHALMPDALWDAAAAAARQHGLYRTARTLRVDYGALKKHVEAPADPGHARSSTTFVELAPSGPTSPPECVIEIEGPRGTMRIRVNRVAWRDIMAVAHLAWGEAP